MKNIFYAEGQALPKEALWYLGRSLERRLWFVMKEKIKYLKHSLLQRRVL